MKKIDCFGDICPIPLLKAQKETAQMSVGDEVIIVTDHSCTVESIEEYYLNTSFKMEIDEVINGVWEIHITKGKKT
jgi:tRNA 2-thiouridine synthesizing protein A